MTVRMHEQSEHELKMSALDLATRLISYNENGDKSLSKDSVLEAAKEFYAFIKGE